MPECNYIAMYEMMIRNYTNYHWGPMMSTNVIDKEKDILRRGPKKGDSKMLAKIKEVKNNLFPISSFILCSVEYIHFHS